MKKIAKSIKIAVNSYFGASTAVIVDENVDSGPSKPYLTCEYLCECASTILQCVARHFKDLGIFQIIPCMH